MSDDGLFPPLEHEVPEPVEVLTPGQRRKRRHLKLIEQGHHPLLVTLSKPGVRTKIHPQAPADCRPDFPVPNRAFTCGSCVFRQLTYGGAREYPKCHKDFPHRATHGEATDVRAWWPACLDYEPKG